MTQTKSAAAERIGKVIGNLIRLFVLHPEDLVVHHVQTGSEMYLRIDAHAGDIGRIIGTKGAHIKALQVIVKIAANLQGMKGTIKPLATDGVGKPDRYPAFKARVDWRKNDIAVALGEVLALTLKEPDDYRVEFVDRDADCESAIMIHAASSNWGHRDELDNAINVLLNSAGKANGRTLASNLECRRAN